MLCDWSDLCILNWQWWTPCVLLRFIAFYWWRSRYHKTSHVKHSTPSILQNKLTSTCMHAYRTYMLMHIAAKVFPSPVIIKKCCSKTLYVVKLFVFQWFGCSTRKTWNNFEMQSSSRLQCKIPHYVIIIVKSWLFLHAASSMISVKIWLHAYNRSRNILFRNYHGREISKYLANPIISVCVK